MSTDHAHGHTTGAGSGSDVPQLVALVAANVGARDARRDGAIREAEEYTRRGDGAWLGIVREQHGTSIPAVHVQLFYNRCLASLRRRPSDRTGLEPATFGAEPADEELRHAFGDGHTLTAPYELTRAFFVRLRQRVLPWGDEGDAGFHAYLGRSAKWYAVAYKRKTGVLPRRASPPRAEPASPAPDPRRVRDVLVSAVRSPVAAAVLAESSWVDATQRAVLRLYVAEARGGREAGPQAVDARAVQATADAILERVAADSGFVPPLEPPVEALVGALFRSKAKWDVAWTGWSAGLEPGVVRRAARWYVGRVAAERGWGAEREDLERRIDARLQAGRPEEVAAVCEAVLPAAIVRVVEVLTRGFDALPHLGDALSRGIVEDARGGMTGGQIATKRGITVALVYKRLERLRTQVTAHLARTFPGLLLGDAARPAAGERDA